MDPFGIFLNLYRSLWIIMDIYGAYEPSQTFTDLYGTLLTCMDLFGPIWTLMDLMDPYEHREQTITLF